VHNFCDVNGIFGPVYKNNFACRERHEEELYEFLDGPSIVKYIKIRSLQWAGHIVGMDRVPRKVLDGKFHRRRRVGRLQLRWEGIMRRLLFAAECNRMEESSRG